eukprot:Em0002g1873a
MLSMAVRKDEQGWDLLLPTLLLAHRTSHHATTRSTPFELMIGHDPRLPEDVLFMQQAHARVLQYMELQQQRQKEYYDKGVTEKTYATVEVLGPSVYRIADCVNPKRQKVVHFNRLKPAPERLKHHHPIQHQDSRIAKCHEDTPPDPTAGDHNENIQPSIVPMQPEDRQPVIGPAPNVPGPRLSTRVRRPTMHYGDPAEIPDTIQDEELFG